MKKLLLLSTLLLSANLYLNTTQTAVAVKIGLKKTERNLIATMLNRLLADEYTLYTKTLNYHWNVKGLMFNDLHLLFDRQYQELFEIIDVMAERVQAIGHQSLGTLEEFKKHTRLQEESGIVPDYKTMLLNLLYDHETIIREIRTGITLCAQNEDYGTENFLADLIEKQEKMAWILRSYVS